MQTLSGVINQARGGMDPNINVDPTSRNMFGGMSPFSSPTSINSALNDIVPLQSSRPFENINRVVYTHTEYPWTDECHLYISPGALLFGDRHSEKENKYFYADATLATVNNALRQGFNMFTEAARRDNSDATVFKANVLDDPIMLEEIEAYMFRVNRGYGVSDVDDNVKRYANDLLKFQYRCMTKQGILAHYNFLGVVQTRGDSSDRRGREYDEGQMCNVSYVARGQVRVGNIWGGPKHVTHGAKLYLVLNRDEDGMYQIQPRVTRKERLQMKKGDQHFWYVGSVAYRADATPAPQFIKHAIGHKNPVSAFKALETLPRIVVNVQI